MRAIWKGALTFGLVNVPVKVYSATEDHDVPLHQVHASDGGRIRYQRICELDGEVVPYAEIDKAYDDGDRTVVLTADDIASLPAERSREIEVVEFVPTEQIDLLTLDRAYYLEPDSASPKAYVLLRKTLEQTERTAIVHFTLRSKTRLGVLRRHEDLLVLQTLRDQTRGRLAVVFGAGGNRDAGKREPMGEIAAAHADVVIVTDDDPHDEDPAGIRAEVIAGARQARDEGAARATEIEEIHPRATAIRTAAAMAGPRDSILVAGRGHETTQEIAGVDHPLDDRQELRDALHDTQEGRWGARDHSQCQAHRRDRRRRAAGAGSADGPAGRFYYAFWRSRHRGGVE